ncbi:hypothetical protein TcWFU_006285 [Taenia crassiceps]|uniref:DUF5727 domain-containing protein n=1 Tax=Taenia crassiceps TaxID=6207 RepID=A0ABR4QDX9_9CEST
MLNSTLCLVFLLAHFASGVPELLGSRVIAQPCGPLAAAMFFRYNIGSPQGTLRSSGARVNFVIDSGVCRFSNGTVIGYPCFSNYDKSQFALRDVSLFSEITLISKRGIYTIFFVPFCDFEKYQNGIILVKYSWPLSRFQKNKTSVYVEFGLRGADAPLNVRITYNSEFLCSWRNDNLEISRFDNCSWEKNYSEDCKIFRGHFRRAGSTEYSSIDLDAGGDLLSVSVDWTQEGVSSEVQDCLVLSLKFGINYY